MSTPTAATMQISAAYTAIVVRSWGTVGYNQTASMMAAPNESTVRPKKKPQALMCSRSI